MGYRECNDDSPAMLPVKELVEVMGGMMGSEAPPSPARAPLVRLVSDFSWAHCEHPGAVQVLDRCAFCMVSWQLVQYGSRHTGTSVVAPDGVRTRAYAT